MIVKHEGTNLIMNPKRENFFEFFVQALASIRRVKDCFEITEGIIDGDIDGFDGLDELEQNKFIDVNALESFAYKGFSKYQSIAVVIRYALGTIAGFNKMVSDFVDDGLFLAEDECEQLNKMLNQIISELVYAVYYEFDIPTHAVKEERVDKTVILALVRDRYTILQKAVKAKYGFPMDNLSEKQLKCFSFWDFNRFLTQRGVTSSADLLKLFLTKVYGSTINDREISEVLKI